MDNRQPQPKCKEIISSIPEEKISAFLKKLQEERLQRKAMEIEILVSRLKGAWDDACFITLARSLGGAANGSTLSEWAINLPLNAAAHHRDDLFQIEALFFGNAGLLDKVDEKYQREYAYLQRKFRLPPVGAPDWQYKKVRPQDFPLVRIQQLAKMYHEWRTNLSAIIDSPDLEDLSRLYTVNGASLTRIVINAVAPLLYAYGKSHERKDLSLRALRLLSELKPEDNHIVRLWKEGGIKPKTALDTQALIELQREYCEKDKCFSCLFGRKQI